MTTMKDKLSASVRQAKAAAETEKPAADKPAAGVSKSVTAAHKPAAASAPSAAAAPKAMPAKAPTKPGKKDYAGGIPESGSTLHPSRVWPD